MAVEELDFGSGMQTEWSREMDVTVAHVACASLPYRQSLSPESASICSWADKASICLAAAAVMALLLGYGLVTLPEMLLQASRRPPQPLHILTGISPHSFLIHRVNAATWWGLSNSSTTFWPTINFSLYLFIFLK